MNFPRLPQAANAELFEARLYGDDYEVARLGLRNEHPVERITVGARQRSRPRGVIDGDWQLLEALSGNDACNVEGYGPGLRQLANTVLSGYLPR